MPYTYDYLDPIHIVWRKGDASDPYIDKIENIKVANQTIVLSEIPDKLYKVRITGLQEVNADKVSVKDLSDNQYMVNYQSGIIRFNSAQETNTLSITYKGRGFIQYPASRIYYNDKFNNVILTLDELLTSTFTDINELIVVINEKLKIYDDLYDALNALKVELNVTIDDSKIATQNAIIATNNANDAYKTTRLVFQPYVTTFSQIGVKYPKPQVGWTTQVYDTGIRYRYDGITWVPIDLFGGNMHNANSTTDGLMSKEKFNQVNTLQTDVNNLKAIPTDRLMVFSINYLTLGVNMPIGRFPFKGTITEIKAICSKPGSDVATKLDIEKSTDMKSWTTIMNGSLVTFDANSNFDNGGHNLLLPNVNEGDLFRVNVKTLSNNIEGMTLQIKVKL